MLSFAEAEQRYSTQFSGHRNCEGPNFAHRCQLYFQAPAPIHTLGSHWSRSHSFARTHARTFARVSNCKEPKQHQPHLFAVVSSNIRLYLGPDAWRALVLAIAAYTHTGTLLTISRFSSVLAYTPSHSQKPRPATHRGTHRKRFTTQRKRSKALNRASCAYPSLQQRRRCSRASCPRLPRPARKAVANQ